MDKERAKKSSTLGKVELVKHNILRKCYERIKCKLNTSLQPLC